MFVIRIQGSDSVTAALGVATFGRAPKDHINTRIRHSGSNAQDKGESKKPWVLQDPFAHVFLGVLFRPLLVLLRHLYEVAGGRAESRDRTDPVLLWRGVACQHRVVL